MRLADYFRTDYPGQPFQLFGRAHVTVLLILLVINIGWFVWPSPNPAVVWGLRVALALGLLAIETSWHLWNWRVGWWNVQTMLPFHLCSILMWLAPVMLLTGNPVLYELVYFFGIAGGLMALLQPDAGRFGFPHFRFWQVMLSHGGLVTAALLMTAVAGYRPTPLSLLRAASIALVYMVAIGGLNARIGSNYMYLARKPDTASLYDIMPPWPWYIGVVIVIAIAALLILYAPFAIIDWLAR